MSHYTEDADMVRVDFFKANENGAPRKWYCTEAVRWLDYDANLIWEAFRDSLMAHLRMPDGSVRLAGMQAICLRPYHKNSHPLCMLVPREAAK